MLWFVALVACGTKDTEPVDTVDTDTADTDPLDTDTDTAMSCDGADCLYDPGRSYPNVQVTTFDTISYTDELGDPRPVPVAVYRPTDAPAPLPIVLLSHGGASGKTNPLNSMEHWAPVLARAGYVSVAIAHAGREEANYLALCAELGVPDNIPCGIKIGWDRPHDVAAVLDWVETQAAAHPGELDLSRIYLVGHSAGAGNALMIAGARRNYRCALPIDYVDPDQDCQESDLVSLADDRVKAVVALSPQGPGNEGFMESSFETVDRPVLVGTGLADGDGSEPANRRLVFPGLPDGDKYELYLDDAGAKHTLFEGDVDACETVDTPERCAEMERWIMTTVVAFLDAQDGRADAQTWLDTDQIETASAGDAEWQTK
jgi:predicted dienelactone hydrolase